jgi:hypothetical protein
MFPQVFAEEEGPMGALASSLQIATVGSALLWPLAAGVAVVLWSKARAAERAKQLNAVDRNLKNLYRDLEARPVPPEIAMVVDALHEGEELAPASAKDKAGAATDS